MNPFLEKYLDVRFDLYNEMADNIKDKLKKGLLNLGLLLEPVDTKKYEFIRLPQKEGWAYFLTSIIELDQLDCIPADDIQPLKEYAKRKGLRITGESTAFLIRVNHTKEKESFVFRLRIRVEECR